MVVLEAGAVVRTGVLLERVREKSSVLLEVVIIITTTTRVLASDCELRFSGPWGSS